MKMNPSLLMEGSTFTCHINLSWGKHCSKLGTMFPLECPSGVSLLFWLWPQCVFRDIFFSWTALKPNLRLSVWMTWAHIMTAYCFTKNTTESHINTRWTQNSILQRHNRINNSWTILNKAGWSVTTPPVVRGVLRPLDFKIWHKNKSPAFL